MPTEYRYEHVFRAPSTQAILAAYFDPDHLATQDKVAELHDRTVVEDVDDGATRRCSWRVTSLKPLPVYVRPFLDGSHLSYLETMVWRRDADMIDLTVVPQMMGGRVQVVATYELAEVAPGQIRRRYHGTVTVDVRLLSGKIERSIVGEIEKGMPLMMASTQRWLDRSYPPDAAAL